MIGFVKADRLVAFVELPRNYGGVDLTTYLKFSIQCGRRNVPLPHSLKINKCNF